MLAGGEHEEACPGAGLRGISDDLARRDPYVDLPPLTTMKSIPNTKTGSGYGEKNVTSFHNSFLMHL